MKNWEYAKKLNAGIFLKNGRSLGKISWEEAAESLKENYPYEDLSIADSCYFEKIGTGRQLGHWLKKEKN